MGSLNRCLLRTCVLALLVDARAAQAQTARTFEDLARVVSANDLVVVTDEAGNKIKGRVVDVSASALGVSAANRSSSALDTRTFADGTVRKITAADPVWNGAIIGAAAGVGFATWDYLIDPSEPGNAAVFAVAIGLGTAVGAGIDGLVHRVIYRRPRHPSRTKVLPLLGHGRQGVLVSVRF
jgi:hypothetical protein